MNILHMKYALEVAKAGSLSKASKMLLVATPNISRSVKELEADLGIEIFIRTTKGIKLTPEGEEFIRFAQHILGQIEAQEEYYKSHLPKIQKFSVSVPRSDYISAAFADFTTSLDENAAEICYRETNAQDIIQSVADDESRLGIIRYAAKEDKYFKELLDQQGLTYELIAEYTRGVLMSAQHPLAAEKTIEMWQLAPYAQVQYADAQEPFAGYSETERADQAFTSTRKILLHDRAAALDLLSVNTEAFQWNAAVPEKTLQRYGLVLKPCADGSQAYREMLIHKKGYRLSALDNRFIDCLVAAKRSALRE